MERSHAAVNGLNRSFSRLEEDIDRQDFKLLIDPAIKKGHAKIFRCNGVFPGQPPVIPRDPRSRRTRIWTLHKADLPVPNFKVDDCYVGIPPQREVLFSSLNDNVDKKFLQQMCERFGKIDAIKIYFDPQTRKHTGKGRVTFSTTTAAKMTVAKLNHTSVMGNIIKAQLEPNLKGFDTHGLHKVSDHMPSRRGTGHEIGGSMPAAHPSAVSRSLSHLPMPPLSVISHSPSSDSLLSSPSLMLRRGSTNTPGRMSGDIWGTSFSNSWDRTSANKVPQAGTAFLSPQSLSSGHSGFEPVSPPHYFKQNEEPPPPPPPSTKPPPPPMERASLKEAPPPPPDEEPLLSSSYMKFEDISPDPVFSPDDEVRTSHSLSREKTNDKSLSRFAGRDSLYNSPPSSKAHSPRSDRREDHKNWEKKKQYEREERNRDKYRDYHKYVRPEDRERKYDRQKRESYFDKKEDKRDYYRRSDHDRNWVSGQWERDDYKQRKDKYCTSPRRGEDCRKTESKETRSRDPRLRERDTESSEGREPHSKDVRDRIERDGKDNRSRDPRLKGRNLESSDSYVRDKKAKDWEKETESSETREIKSKDSRSWDGEVKNVGSRNFGGNEIGPKDGEDIDNNRLKVKDPRLHEKVNGSDISYLVEHSKNVDLKDNLSKQRENYESGERESERTSKDEQSCISDINEGESDSKMLITAADIVSSIVTIAPSGETTPLSKYSEDAYTIGVETCSDEEPLPPGSERDVAHEVQLDITRNKIKAAQNAVKKRKISETVPDDKLDGSSKVKKIQIVLKSLQLNSSERNLGNLKGADSLMREEECPGEGGWRSISPVTADKSTLEVAADVAVSSSNAEESPVTLVNLPLTEDISPCASPALEAVVSAESNGTINNIVTKLSNDLYSDIEGNDDDNDVGNVDNIDDDAMSLSSISSNEDTLEVNKPNEELMQKPKSVSVPPPGVVFPPYPPPIFNPSIPPPPIFNPLVPPPLLGPVTVPPPPLPPVPTVPPPVPVPPPTIRPPSLPPTSIPPPSIPPVPPIPVPPVPIPPPVLGAPTSFFDKRVPPFPGGGFPNSGGFAYQKVEQKKPWRSRIIDEVYRTVYSELDMVLTRDIFKKLVEASAFKALESWWDNQTKPKTSSSTSTSSAPNVPPATVGLPSNSGGVSSTIGPSPFERPPSMMLGLRASLPKLPSFKVKRPPEPAKSAAVDISSRKRISTASPVMHEQEVKRLCVDGGEGDSEMDTDVDTSWDRRPRTLSRMEEEERSQSPWQQLDDSMDVAPPATRVRSTQADERRPSTGSSLYHTVYSSSSSSSSSSESESEDSGSDEDEGEEEEVEGEREAEEGESEVESDEDESESEEESESESEREDAIEHVEEKLDVVAIDEDRQHDENDQGMIPVFDEEKQEIMQTSPTEPPIRSPNSTWRRIADPQIANKDVNGTTKAVAPIQSTSPELDKKAATEQFRSFHIANIVPDLFKNQEEEEEEESQDTTRKVDQNKVFEIQADRTERELDSSASLVKTEAMIPRDSAQNLTEKPPNDVPSIESSEDVTTRQEQLFDAPKANSALEYGFNDDRQTKPPNLEIRHDMQPNIPDDADMDESNGMFDERMPLLSPDKPLAVSLIELDHSYGLAIPDEPRILTPSEEPEVCDESRDELPPLPIDRGFTESPVVDVIDESRDELPPLPIDRSFTESPVVDVIGVDTSEPGLPVPEFLPPKPQFPVRSFEADDELVFEFLKLGVDSEDAYYLKVGFEQLQQVGSESVTHAHWSDHPLTAQPVLSKRRKQKAEHGVRVHVTGCARAEGFYKIDIKEKAKYLQAQRRQLQCKANVTKEEQKTDGSKAKQQSREHRAIQRRLQSAVCNEDFGDLLKFNQLMVRKKQLRFAKSGIHDWGLFALESIAADEMVTEYVGEIIRQPMADIRERRYEEMGIGSSYLFRVDQETIIDATTKGNLARFINHCCDPNCYAKIVTVENAKKIVIYSKRDIAINEEITYDYKFPIEDEKIPCLCGVAQCRGTLN